MKASILVCVAGGFLAGSALGLAQTDPKKPPAGGFTLVDCLNMALQRSPRIQVAQQDVERARGAVVTARAVLYPTINLTAQPELENRDIFGQDKDESSNFRDDWQIRLDIRRSLITPGVNSSNIAIAELDKEVEFIRLQQRINEVIFETKKAFYSILVARAEIATQKEILSVLEKEVERQQNLFEAGRATKFNIIRTEVRLANERPSLLEAQNRLTSAALDLSDLLAVRWEGQNPEKLINARGGFDCPPLELDFPSLLRLALTQRPEARQFLTEAKIAELREKVARASNLPRLEMFVQATQRRDRGAGSSYFASDNELVLGVLGTWTLFDGYEGKGRAIQAQADKKSAMIEHAASLRKIEIDVRKALLNLDEASSSLKSQQGNVQKAEEALRLARTTADAGFGSQFDILQATVDLNSAKNIELRARYNYHLALAELEQALFLKDSSLQAALDSIRAQEASAKPQRATVPAPSPNATTPR